MTRELAMVISILARFEYNCPCDGCQSILFQNFFWDAFQIRHEITPIFIIG